MGLPKTSSGMVDLWDDTKIQSGSQLVLSGSVGAESEMRQVIARFHRLAIFIAGTLRPSRRPTLSTRGQFW